MRTTAVIIQSNYLPWKGYFDQIRRADNFILLDCVQYTRRDWRNRNKIKTPQGPQWLTVPVEVRGRYSQAIDEARICGQDWVENHIRSIEANYRRAPHFEQEAPWLYGALREAARQELLSPLNLHLLEALSQRIGIVTPTARCEELIARDDLQAMDSSERLLALCKAVDATHYLSGPAAQAYLNVAAFENAGVAVEWMDYSGYPAYPQLWGPFEHGVSIIDLLLNVGADDVLSYLHQPIAAAGKAG